MKQQLSFPKDPTTAIVIPMPPTVQEISVSLVSQYSPQVHHHYPAHITLFIPFVPFDSLDETCQTLREICSDISPFDVTLDGYGEFPTVLFMKPQDPAPIHQLFQSLFFHFPDYPPYAGQYGTTINPHITIAILDSPEDKKVIHLPDYEPITVEINRLNVIYGSLDIPVPFTTYDVIRLG